ncbi:MAG TPA: hypothetical protein VMZ28_16445, partial [Kofleriaceae bacterium]|nr:hypothetical protein [Kofleriaceae bacterium]
DGLTDLVQDVDIVITGEDPADGHDLVAKTSVAPDGVDGPDDDAFATAYWPDAVTLLPMSLRDTTSTATAGAYQRIAGEGSSEVKTDGNGIGGHDETSEDSRATWEQVKNSVPTPGEVADTLRPPCVTP